MNPTIISLELKRLARDYVGLFFIAVLPAFMYVVFGAAQTFAQEDIGRGNVALYIMISMAVYGAVTATVSVGGSSAVERMQGWGRQLGLTPLRDASYVGAKALVAMVVACIPIGLIYAIGSATGAEGDAWVWLATAGITLFGACLFALYGLVFGLAFTSESAVGAASGSLVIFAFLGNIFIPLSGVMLTIAKFTPLYGIVSLARYPLTEGYSVDMDGNLSHEALWVPLVNVGVWTLILALLTVYLVRRGRDRQ
ncbi:putative ABC transporter permease [Janibacter hoylei PVAS-1]|uniref:ABC transporter permease n=1 Tax=Janibacter hoylei PVAS-1 TaxID=1210046 RepID=K1DZS8_9MICO|nr:ABC transporter permease [Janibacter hoylei]EKA62130.1 putative ABC transporter permease [Janibacter hoylei PVAS-1]RWU85145.1 ABC transporter permease [Janibacter hoylei PVAS-1]